MKLLLVSDLHLRHSRPRSRTDGWPEVVYRKLGAILGIWADHGCDAILQAGDFFDSPSVSLGLVSSVIEQFRYAFSEIPRMFCVCGQHDIVMHSLGSVHRSPLRVLEAAGVVEILKGEGEPATLATRGECVHIYGASFGQEIPEPEFPNDFMVLVAHVGVGDKPLFPGHEITYPEQFARRHPWFNLILLGDYHYPFVQTVKTDYAETLVVNTGCMLRLRAVERDMERVPHVSILDTTTMELTEVPLPCEPPERVFDAAEQEEDSDERSDRVAALAAKLRSGEGTDVSFRSRLELFYRNNDVPESVREVIADGLEAIRDE